MVEEGGGYAEYFIIKSFNDILGTANDDGKVFEQVCINGGHFIAPYKP